MSDTWPHDCSFVAFKKQMPFNQSSIYRLVFRAFSNRIQVRREEAAVPNLEKILKATFRLSGRHSFDAMSLRDLSKETGISMGGLYNYIGSKEDLAHMIESFMDIHVRNTGRAFVDRIDDLQDRLETTIRVYIYMGEIFLPWYQFIFMETKSMTKRQKEMAKGMEIRDVKMFRELVEAGQAQGLFDPLIDSNMVASSILVMIQNWYLKNWRFTREGVSADDYADFTVSAVNKLLARCQSPPFEA